MIDSELQKVLEHVRSKTISLPRAIEKIKKVTSGNIEYARVDLQRLKRRGFPEVVFCLNKTPRHVAGIIGRLDGAAQNILATRATREMYLEARKVVKGLRYIEGAGAIVKRNTPVKKTGRIMVLSAGTSDLPVAEEAVVTAQEMGSRVEKAYDVGVAGVHRLLDMHDNLKRARVIVAVAGMEGALASVVSGLVSAPVIAVPTSVGYGASFGGIAPLLGMLNSCSAGVAVVNIDNGFGAGYIAHLINVRQK